MKNKDAVNIFWFRRDLRLHDNTGLYHALTSDNPVQPVFIFDTNILGGLEDKADKRIVFIHHALQTIQAILIKSGATLDVRIGTPEKTFVQLVKDYSIEKVFVNNDYEPHARERDNNIYKFLKEQGIAMQGYKDQVIFEKTEIVKDDGKPYSIYTPYSRKWKTVLQQNNFKIFESEKQVINFYKQKEKPLPPLTKIGFENIGAQFPSAEIDENIILKYTTTRDFPAMNGTSKLSVHLRFGTISIRQLTTIAQKLNEKFLNELIWRDFYQMILYHYPDVVHQSFKKQYDNIQWRNNETELVAWCNGQTGYPIVDAGMRELNETGLMHNRVRMIVASFLSKHLLIDWRLGEAYFAKKLLDYELASNNGGWQWAAGCGCDAAPYFRVFNPYIQTKKFDPDLKYIRKWVPEFESFDYPKPIVEHEFARKRCIEVYSKALRQSN